MTDAERTRLAAEGMYRPDYEGDACGVGLIAAVDGRPTRAVVEAATAHLPKPKTPAPEPEAEDKGGDKAGD